MSASLSIEAVSQYLRATFTDIHVDTTTPDLFFFAGAERSFPFATIVTRDYESDSHSRLDGDGAFRLSIGVGAATFASLFPALASPRDLEAAAIDYAARDQLTPHPVYGRMRWICVVNPSQATFERCRALLAEAYDLALQRTDKGG